ncbi:MAG: DUF167 domain-containing protein [Brevinematia bacterium]
MVIEVKVKPNSRREVIKKVGDNLYEVWVNALPVEGRVNNRLIEMLSEYFGVPKSSISLKAGVKSRVKIFEIE